MGKLKHKILFDAISSRVGFLAVAETVSFAFSKSSWDEFFQEKSLVELSIL